MEEYLSEKEQWESLTGWLRENGLWIFAGVAVGALGLGGYRLWNAHIDQVAGEASAKFGQLTRALDRGDRTETLVRLGELERDYAATPYLDQARLAAAQLYVESRELDKAAAELKSVIEHSKDRELALIARLRLARVQISAGKADAALATLNGVQPGAFAAHYHEVMGDAYFAQGKQPLALKEYRDARAAAVAGDAAGLDLKISDLSAEEPSAAPSGNGQPAAAQPAPGAQPAAAAR